MAIVFPASPSVNETFTAGSITYKWDGDKWIGLGVTPADRLIEGSNSLEIDASNNLSWTGNNVQLGPTTATSKLTLSSTTTGTFDALNIASGLTSASGYQVGISSTGNVFHWNTTDSWMNFATNNTERFRITEDGDLIVNNNLTPTHSTQAGSIFLTIPSEQTGNPSRGICWAPNSDTHYVKLESTVIDGLVINGYSGVAFATGSRSNSTWTERARFDLNGRLLIGNSTATITEAKIEAYTDNAGNNDILCLYNKNVATGNTANILFAPSNTVAGGRIICEAMEDFSTSANRTADLSFVTRQDGTLAEAARMSGAGYFTVPRQPSFRAGRSTNYTPGALTDIIFNVTNGTYQHNIGGHYSTSNGRFTAPVAGTYIFSAMVIWQNLTSGQAMDDAFEIRVNDALAGYSSRRGEYIDGTTGNGGYYVDSGTYEIYLEANEYVTIRNRAAGLQVHGNTYYTTFSGCLIC